MSNPKKSHTILIVFIILIVSWAVEMFFFYKKIDEVQETCVAMEKKEMETAAKLREMERLAAYNKDYIDQLMKNQEFVEMEARSRLGVAVPGEVVIREEGSERKASINK